MNFINRKTTKRWADHYWATRDYYTYYLKPHTIGDTKLWIAEVSSQKWDITYNSNDMPNGRFITVEMGKQWCRKFNPRDAAVQQYATGSDVGKLR